MYKIAQHKKNATLRVHLAKGLRSQLNKRAIGIRTGDNVTVIKGSSAGKSGKVGSVNTHKRFIYVEGITRKKSDGTEIGIPFRAPNLVLTELETKDNKRFKRGKKPVQKKKAEKSVKKTENKTTKKEEKTEKKKGGK